MSQTFTRQELFDLVWSAPTRTVAKNLGISDVGLAKACRRADLLLPPCEPNACARPSSW
jgi:hypothetical protein